VDLPGVGAPLHGLSFAPDGQWLAAGGHGVLYVWNLARPDDPPARWGGLSDYVNEVAFSPDGRWVVAGAGHRVWIWDRTRPGEGRVLGDPLGIGRWIWLAAEGHSSSVESLAFSPDSRQLASAGLTGTVLLWDVQNPLAPVQRLQVP
jgi:WD40 repeat protein